MADDSGDGSDGELPPGTHCQLYYDHPRDGPGYWNAVVDSNAQPCAPGEVAMVVRTGATPLCTDIRRMRYHVELTLSDLDTQISPGWRLPRPGGAGAHAGDDPPEPASRLTAHRSTFTSDRSSAGAGASVDTVPSARQSRATRRQQYADGSARRRRVRQRHTAAAMQSALSRPRQGTPRHMLWLMSTTFMLGTPLLWDVCSGPHKSMALAAEDAVEGMQALTLDCNPLFCADVTMRFEDWDPFGFMLAHYTVGDQVMMPYHIHFSPPCATFCVQTQGLHGRQADQPGGHAQSAPVVFAANQLVLSFVQFMQAMAEIPGAATTYSIENPAGKLWEYLAAVGATGLIKHVVNYCRYGRKHKKTSHIMLSSGLKHFRGKTCITARQDPQCGICGAVRYDESGDLVHPGSDGGATIEDARMPVLLCGDIISAFMEYHHLARLSAPRQYLVVPRRFVEHAAAQWRGRQRQPVFGQQLPRRVPRGLNPNRPARSGVVPNSGGAKPPRRDIVTSTPARKRRRGSHPCQRCQMVRGPRFLGLGGRLVCRSCADECGAV